MIASNNGHIEVVKELIERGADINAKTTKSWSYYKIDAGSTALDFAKKRNHQDIVALLSARH